MPTAHKPVCAGCVPGFVAAANPNRARRTAGEQRICSRACTGHLLPGAGKIDFRMHGTPGAPTATTARSVCSPGSPQRLRHTRHALFCSTRPRRSAGAPALRSHTARAEGEPQTARDAARTQARARRETRAQTQRDRPAPTDARTGAQNAPWNGVRHRGSSAAEAATHANVAGCGQPMRPSSTMDGMWSDAPPKRPHT